MVRDCHAASGWLLAAGLGALEMSFCGSVTGMLCSVAFWELRDLGHAYPPHSVTRTRLGLAELRSSASWCCTSQVPDPLASANSGGAFSVVCEWGQTGVMLATPPQGSTIAGQQHVAKQALLFLSVPLLKQALAFWKRWDCSPAALLLHFAAVLCAGWHKYR